MDTEQVALPVPIANPGETPLQPALIPILTFIHVHVPSALGKWRQQYKTQ